MSYATIQWQQSGGIGRITLNRPETLNAWTAEFGAELKQAVNEDAAEGLGSVARAAQIGAYFTDDVVVELGQGMGPIQGRESVTGMAARLPPGPGGYDLQFDDVSVNVAPHGDAADVDAAAMLTRRNDATGERSVDAREVSLGMRKVDGVWRIARVTAVDTLRRD